MSLESNLELNNQLVAQNNDLLTQLLAAMVSSKTFTADTPHQPKAESKTGTAGKEAQRTGPFFWKSLDGLQLGEVSDLAELEAITEANAGVEINKIEFLQRKEEAEKSKAKNPTLEDQPLPVAVALAALYGAGARTPAAAQLSAAVAITETATGKERSEQIDALTMALTGVDLAAKLHGAGVFDLALQMLEHWDALPGITERRDYATLLLNTPVAKRADVKPAKPKTTTTKQKDVAEDPKALFAKAEQLILSLAKGGYRSEAVQILADHSAKKLGEVTPEDLPSVIAAAEKALEG